MRAVLAAGPVRSRRWFLGAFCVSTALAADAREAPSRLIGELAGALTGGDPLSTMACFSRACADYETVEVSVQALTAQTDISCAIDVLEESGQGTTRIFDTDWLMRLTTRGAENVTEGRRERVKIGVSVEGSRWRVVSLAPVTVLRPIRIAEL